MAMVSPSAEPRAEVRRSTATMSERCPSTAWASSTFASACVNGTGDVKLFQRCVWSGRGRSTGNPRDDAELDGVLSMKIFYR